MRIPSLLVLLLLVPTPALASSSSAKPHVFFGEVKADTVQATLSEVYPAAVKAFTDDDWKVPFDSTKTHVLTEWREFHHPLAKMLLGKLWARCEVDIRPLDRAHVVLLFRGGIASPNDIESNPAFALAKAAYYEAVHGYYRDLHTNLADERKSKPSDPSPMGQLVH
ncbi:MAG TPA: hypothetical protein VKF80_09780 [Candidatus Eisenbacteria bacterium]|nr:hypothetical protein [Candidatus Eisenbacteria bacterium]